MKFWKEFWLDYAVSNYNKLKKYDSDPELDILLNLSFIQSLNVDIVLVIIFKLINFQIRDFKYMIIVTVIIFIFNYVSYNKLKTEEKMKIKARTPKYGVVFYRMYALFSAVSLFVLAYLLLRRT